MSEKGVIQRLTKLQSASVKVPVNEKSKLVIFSDLHMGNGGSRDDFFHNGEMMQKILEDYYYSRDYMLILNGDIDELLRFSHATVEKKWERLYRLFDNFHQKKALYKLFGNHDISHNKPRKSQSLLPVHESVTLQHTSGDLLVFHGHQAGWMCSEFANRAIAFILKYLATPLGIKNYLVAHDSKKRFYIEKRVYDFARNRKIIAVIGHTHRPLFESLSKIDNLKFKIEQFCRRYPRSDQQTQQKLERRIKKYKNELQQLVEKREEQRGSLYQSEPLVPCMFNSGCAVGKSGVTSIEISDNNIKLIYWFDEKKSRKYFDFNGYCPEKLTGTDFYRVVLNKEPLDYIFTRIKLLS